MTRFTGKFAPLDEFSGLPLNPRFFPFLRTDRQPSSVAPSLAWRENRSVRAGVIRRVVFWGGVLLFFAMGGKGLDAQTYAPTGNFAPLWEIPVTAPVDSALLDTTSVDSAGFPLLASRGTFDFALTGTGEYTTPTLPAPNSLPNYATIDEGTQRFFVPDAMTSDLPIAISANAGWKGSVTDEGEVYILSGDCRIVQGDESVGAPQAVVWLRSGGTSGGATPSGKEVVVYLEKETPQGSLLIHLDRPFLTARTSDLGWLGSFRTTTEQNLHIAEPGTNQLDPDAIYRRALALRSQQVSAGEVQNIPLTSRLAERLTETERLAGGKFGLRRIRILSRYDHEMTIRSEQDPASPSQSRWVISGGFTMIIEGIATNGKTLSDVIDLSADNAVLWAPNLTNLAGNQENLQSGELDLDLYLEGDIVFREGERVVYAEKMYYDVKNRIGLIRDTEMVIPVPNTPGGLFRMRADSVTQSGTDSLSAKNAWVSTSRMGWPSYRLQSNALTAESRRTPLFDAGTRQPLIDPATGEQKTDTTQYIIAENNFVTLGSVPIFYWPWMAMDTRDQTLYLRKFQVSNDSAFGTQVRTGWNPYQIFNMSKCRPDGTDWEIDLDWLSKRGFGHGSSFLYNRDSVFGCQTPAIGMANFYGIADGGTDNLGLGRRNVDFPHGYRYRGIWKHRQIFSLPWCFGDGWVATAQFGKSSDKNYLPEYFEQEWFTQPNPETSLEIKKTVNNWSLGLMADFRTDTFYTQTNHLPQLSHYWIGQPLGCTNLIWYEHTKVGFQQFRTAGAPWADEDRAIWRYLDWELAPNSTDNTPDQNAETLSRDTFAFSTRHELDLPLEAGPVKITPYGLGEYGFWSQAYEGSVNRLYGRGGVRANLPAWKVNADVSSQTFYLNGLAHKMNFAVDAFYSKATQHLGDMVLYDAMDDWQTEDFRRMYSVTTFSNTYEPFRDSIPIRFDERYYALRQGLLGGAVTSPVTEIADDLTQIRLDWLNRWQTKRGPVGKRHIVDWITFDTGVSLYPQKEQNFGQNVGLIDYDLRWHVGDRFSVLSSGMFDVFDSGQKITRAGVLSKRPSVSSFYLGVDWLSGPINSMYLNAAINYRMSEKWAASFSNSYDLASGLNVGQQLGVSRIGESFIFTLSASLNQSKNNWGLSLNVLPVFLFNNKRLEEDVLGLGPM